MGGPLRWYPAAWRERYGDELLAYLYDAYGPGPLPLSVYWSLGARGLWERARYAGLVGSRVPVTERVRAGVLVVLGAWTAFFVAVLSFAKLSEDFRFVAPALPATQARTARSGGLSIGHAAFDVLEVVWVLAVLAVVAGTALAVPAFWRFLRDGGWPVIRGHVLRAGFVTVASVIATGALVAWAHHLTWPQRNGALPGYGVAFVGWAGLVAACLALWTVAAVAAARRMDIPWVVLFFQAMVAIAVAVSMVVMLVATAVWWTEVSRSIPHDVQVEGWSSSFAGHGSPWSVWLALTVGLMAVSAAGGLAGAVRIAGVWRPSRRWA